MIYGQLAKQYGASNYKVVSESDAILDYMFSEAKQYQNLILTESFFDNEERMVMEAKMEVLQEAISGAIIAAIIAIVGAISALIVLIIKLIKKGKEKLDQKKIGEAKNLTDEQKKEIEAKIKEHVESVKWSNADKSKLMNFSTYDFIGSCPIINDMRDVLRVMISQMSPLSNISSSSSTDSLKSIVDEFYTGIKQRYDKFKQSGKTEESLSSESGENLLLNYYYAGKVMGGPVGAIGQIVRFKDSNYFKRSEDAQKEMNEDADKLKKFLEENQDKIQSATQTKDKDSDYTDVSNKLNEGLKMTKELLGFYRGVMKQWFQIEQFRIRYCSIVTSYFGISSDGDDKKDKKDKKEDK